jgi:hypothetical protein
MVDRSNIRDAASTLAYLWAHAQHGDPRDCGGVERLLLAYPEASRVLLCAHVVRQLHCQAASPDELEAFLDLLADIACIDEE